MEAIQKQLKEALLKAGIPAKEVQIYGSQIVITAWSLDAANQWAVLVAKFATVRRVMESTDDNQEARKLGPSMVVAQSFHRVWRVYGVIA